MTGEQTAAGDAAAPQDWLVALKDKAARSERPREKPFGRWLGDFLDRDTTTGLLKTELDLLDSCAKGKPCVLAVNARTREEALQNNPIRADFLRFLAFGGDESAPVHEASIELHNALIENNLDLRGGKCIGRLALIKCVLRGDLSIEDASLGTLTLRGSRLAGINGNRAKISGTLFLDKNSVSDGDVLLSSAQIGSSLDCRSAEINGALNCVGAKIGADLICDRATVAGGIEARGAVIAGDASFLSLNARRAVSLVNADIGGSLRCSGATFRMDHRDATPPKEVMLDCSNVKINGDVELKFREKGPLLPLFMTEGAVHFVSAEIGGDVDLRGYSISAVGTEPGRRRAVNAENVRVGGSMYFGDGFVANGEVSLSGAECGEMNCNGGTFSNPGLVALDCRTINVKGSVFLGNVGVEPFKARGSVWFHTAQIGQHLYCGGGRFSNPGGEALNCDAGKIAGCVFLGRCDGHTDAAPLPDLAFCSDGKVTFVGASVGLQFDCQWGRFRNAAPDPSNNKYADAALDLSAARIGDTLFLGKEKPADEPATIKGSIDLTGATVRVLVDDGLVDDGIRGFRPTVEGEPQRYLKLDLFSYERLKDASTADLRKAWLRRQPREDLERVFRPQPFEQLTQVLRAMGLDDEADEIARAKREYARKAGPWWTWLHPLRSAWGLLARFVEFVFLAGFLGYGYRIGRALFILLLLGAVFGLFYGLAFQQGAIVPVDKDIRKAACVNWSLSACPAMADKTIPLFNKWIYSADVMIPIIGFGQKSAWVPTHDRSVELPILGRTELPKSFVYWVQLLETVLGWAAGVLLASFVSGLIAKE